MPGPAACKLAGSNATGTSTISGDLTLSVEVQKMRARVDYIVVYDTTQ